MKIVKSNKKYLITSKLKLRHAVLALLHLCLNEPFCERGEAVSHAPNLSQQNPDYATVDYHFPKHYDGALYNGYLVCCINKTESRQTIAKSK